MRMRGLLDFARISVVADVLASHSPLPLPLLPLTLPLPPLNPFFLEDLDLWLD